jgi:hypothetical protein
VVVSGENIVIRARYAGPDGSGNGGYACGRVAQLVDASTVEVTLRLPPPLERPLTVERDDGRVRVLDGDALVAEGAPAADLGLDPPGVSWAQAEEATARYTGFEEHDFPRCFVCGPLRGPGDGLRIFPGGVEPGIVAAPWVAREVAPEIVWASIDCAGAYAAGFPNRGSVVLGRMTGHVERLPEDGEPCVVVGWAIGEDGRKLHAGTALLGANGAPCAVSRQTWIEPLKAAA